MVIEGKILDWLWSIAERCEDNFQEEDEDEEDEEEAGGFGGDDKDEDDVGKVTTEFVSLLSVGIGEEDIVVDFVVENKNVELLLVLLTLFRFLDLILFVVVEK